MNAWYHNIWMKREYDNACCLITFCSDMIWLFTINDFKISIVCTYIVCVACSFQFSHFSFLFLSLLLSELLSWSVTFLLSFLYFTCFVFSILTKIAALWLCCHIWSLHAWWFVQLVWLLWWNCDQTVKFKFQKSILTWVLSLWHHMLQRHVSMNSKIIIKTRFCIFQSQINWSLFNWFFHSSEQIISYMIVTKTSCIQHVKIWKFMFKHLFLQFFYVLSTGINVENFAISSVYINRSREV